MSRTAMQQALVVLVGMEALYPFTTRAVNAITALRAALAEQPAPVAWLGERGDVLLHHPEEYGRDHEQEWFPLCNCDAHGIGDDK